MCAILFGANPENSCSILQADAKKVKESYRYFGANPGNYCSILQKVEFPKVARANSGPGAPQSLTPGFPREEFLTPEPGILGILNSEKA